MVIIPQTSSDGKFHKGKGATVAGAWLLRRFCATAPSLGVRRLRDSRASLSCDLPPPACLLPGQQETTVGQVPDGLFCHTLRNAIDCGSEEAIYCNLWGKDWGIMTARKKREVCRCCKWNQAQGLQAALEAKWRHREAWDAPRVTGTVKSKGIGVVERVVFASAEQPHSSSSSNTSLYCLWRNALVPHSPSLWFTGGGCISHPQRVGPYTRSDQSVCSALPGALIGWWMEMCQKRMTLNYQYSVGTPGRDRGCPFAGFSEALRTWIGLPPERESWLREARMQPLGGEHKSRTES